MAKKDEQTSTLIKPVDADRVIRILTHDIAPAEEKNAKSRGDLSAAWKSIESDCNCVKGAAKLYFKLTRMTDEARDDYLRSLWLLMKAGGLGISQDLVDQMNDEDAPTMPIIPASGSTLDNLATVN